MKKFIVIALFLIGIFVSAQEKSNPFSETERVDQHANSDQVAQAAGDGPGNPDGGDDLPIDDYLPVLVVVALGIIVFTTQKKNKSMS